MCIRDRHYGPVRADREADLRIVERHGVKILPQIRLDPAPGCLLYTSDAADERSSVDLGGRRIIKKKNNADTRSTHDQQQHIQRIPR